MENTRPNNFNPELIIQGLFKKRITPAEAAKQLKSGFERYDVVAGEAIDRMGQQQITFEEGAYELTDAQKVAWDDTVICLRSILGQPQLDNDSRLKPPGEYVGDIPFEDMPF